MIDVMNIIIIIIPILASNTLLIVDRLQGHLFIYLSFFNLSIRCTDDGVNIHLPT